MTTAGGRAFLGLTGQSIQPTWSLQIQGKWLLGTMLRFSSDLSTHVHICTPAHTHATHMDTKMPAQQNLWPCVITEQGLPRLGYTFLPRLRELPRWPYPITTTFFASKHFFSKCSTPPQFSNITYGDSIVCTLVCVRVCVRMCVCVLSGSNIPVTSFREILCNYKCHFFLLDLSGQQAAIPGNPALSGRHRFGGLFVQHGLKAERRNGNK